MSNETRPGERVRLTMDQADKEGKILWDLQTAWYGFDNATANGMVLGLIHAIGEYTRGLSEAKNS